MGKSVPTPPDFTGAAREQSAASQWLTAFQTAANRPNVYTPWGSMRWTAPGYAGAAPPKAPAPGTGGRTPPTIPDTGGGAPVDLMLATDPGAGAPGGIRSPYDGLPGGWDWPRPYPEPEATPPAADSGAPPWATSENPYAAGGGWGLEVGLSPEQQKALEAQQRIGARRSTLAESLLGNVQRETGPLDFSGLPGMESGEGARRRGEEAAYSSYTSRLDPQWGRREEQLRAQLMSQGLQPGTESWDQQMAQFNRDRNDAYSQARQQAVGQGEQLAQGAFGRGLTGRQQGLAEMLQRRGWSLNEVQALLGGEQVGMPQMPGFSQAGVGQAPNLLGAAGAQYQGELQGYGAQQVLLASLLGGAGQLGAAAFMR